MRYTSETKTIENFACHTFDTYFGNLRVGILDIETSGLSPESSRLILGGLITVEPSEKVNSQGKSIGDRTITVESYFNEFGNEMDEVSLLEAYLEAIKGLDMVVTYNGASFDLPFIHERAARLGLDSQNGFPFCLDLYKVLNQYSSLRKILPDLKQKTVEAYFGLSEERKDKLTGRESIDLYYAYLAHPLGTTKEITRNTILLHNSDDCMQLLRLLPIVAKTDFHAAVFNQGFTVGNLYIKDMKYFKEQLSISGVQRLYPRDYKAYPDAKRPYSLLMHQSNGEFEILYPCHKVKVSKDYTIEILDAKSAGLGDSVFGDLPGYERGYIIISEDGRINYFAINMFVRALLEKIQKDLEI